MHPLNFKFGSGTNGPVSGSYVYYDDVDPLLVEQYTLYAWNLFDIFGVASESIAEGSPGP